MLDFDIVPLNVCIGEYLRFFFIKNIFMNLISNLYFTGPYNIRTCVIEWGRSIERTLSHHSLDSKGVSTISTILAQRNYRTKVKAQQNSFLANKKYYSFLHYTRLSYI